MAPALRVPVSVNMQQFEQQMGQLGQVTTRVVKTMRNEFIKLNAEIAVQGVKALGLFGLEVIKVSYQTGLLTASLRTMARTALPIALVVGSFEAIAAITEFAKGKIEEFVKIQEKAAAAGVTTDFFQRWVEGGKAIKLSVDDATAALNKFAEAARSKLGGSDIQKRIVELQEAGNPIDSKAFEGALGNQDKLKEAAALITKMRDEGLVLASIDLAGKTFGPQVQAAFAADAGYLTQMVASMEKIEATKIINQDDINRAVDLTNRLDAAQRLLAEKWVPLQRQILSLGLDYNESWIKLYGLMAQSVAAATSLLGVFGQIGDKLKELGAAPYWDKVLRAAAGGIPVIGPAITGVAGALTGGGAGGPQGSAAEQALRSGLVNPALIKQAQEQATAIQNLMRGDISKPPGGTAAKATEEATTALERQTDALEKHILVQEAAAASAGKGVAAQEEARAKAQLLAAAERDGVTATGEYAAALDELARRAGRAALAQAEAQDKINKLNQASQIFGSAISTAFSDAIVEGKKLNEVLDALLKTLAKAAINASIMNLFTPGAGGVNPFLSFLGLQGKMAGGSVNAGQPYLVGESGPELFRPNSAGMVIPNNVLGRGANDGATVQNNFVVSGDVSQQTIDRLQRAVMAAHQKADSVVKTIVSTQRLQATGVR